VKKIDSSIPQCDIIIVTWNGLEYTKKCVDSVQENTKDVKFRFIFVDNNSSDGTIDYLKKIPNSILISNKENMGFAKAMNLGFDKVTAKYTVWLNNDTIVSHGWLHRLVYHLEQNPHTGAIGPVSNGTGYIQKVQGFKRKDIKNISQFGRTVFLLNKGNVAEYHRIAGFCILMKSELISKVGKIDENFNHGGYDDDDYCKRIRDAGYTILIAEDVFVYHKSGASFSKIKNPDLDLRFLMQKGRRKLLKKWYPSSQQKSDKNPLVSIIMATMNRPKIIKNAIDSVISQTYKNWELIIVNDGGENIQNVIDEYAENRIKLFNFEENGGKSYANYFAIKNANGELIAYLDDDDRWYQNHLEITVNEIMKSGQISLVYTDYVKVDCILNQALNEQTPLRKEIVQLPHPRPHFLDEMNVVPNFAMVHTKDLIAKVGNYDEDLDYYEDWDILRRFSYETPFSHIPEISGEYWIDVTKSGRNDQALFDENLDDIMSYIKEKNDEIKNDILARLENADDMDEKSEWSYAFKIYEEVLNENPYYFPAIEGCADRKFLLGKYSEAEKYFQEMIEIDPYNFRILYSYAENEYFMKKFLKAKSLLESALLIIDDKPTYYLLQKCYQQLGNKKTEKFLEKKTRLIAVNINLRDVEDLLIKLYNEKPWLRSFFLFGYKTLKKLYD